MFTGIVQTTGQLIERKYDDTFCFGNIPDSSFFDDIKIGSSVAINGVCLTVVKLKKETFCVEVMPETLKKTNLGDLNSDEWVNLEKAMSINDRFEGHIVQGHVDDTGVIKKIEAEGNSYLLTISIPSNITKYIVPKGSIALNGISLTVIDVTKKSFRIGIIPHTWEVTMLKYAKVEDKINLETDVIAKYVERMVK